MQSKSTNGIQMFTKKNINLMQINTRIYNLKINK